MDIEVTPEITPTFTQIGQICQNATAPVLPLSSTNTPAVTGTWTPATINTSAPGTVTYRFTPDAGQCAGEVTMDIEVTPEITPTFTQIGQICQNATAPLLPSASTNTPAINGTWTPVTISTAVAGTVTYTFTPDAGQCAGEVTMDIEVTPEITPTFTQIGQICQNATAPVLPLSSTNTPAVTGTWTPATINTSAPGTVTYRFTPDAGQCAGEVTMDIEVTPEITPTFTQIGQICQNATATVLPLSSTNTPAITGTWTPATINTSAPGTVTYRFTPDAGQCATTSTLSVLVNAIPNISAVNSGSRCGAGTVTLSATASAGIINWYAESTGGESLGTGLTYTPYISATTTYYVDATNNDCTTAGRTPVIATVLLVPSPAGSIAGSTTFTPGTTGVGYSVPAITGATGYTWSYSGTGVTITGTGTSITLDFAANATSGDLSVRGTNTCGPGLVSILTLSPANKTLTITSVLLEGLYNGSGTMRQAQNAAGAQWPAGVADHITVELHNGSNYANIVWSQTEVPLSTAGTAVITVPAIYNGSYYITVKHRNSLETTTSVPVSFAGSVINRLFGARANIYGANLRASGDSYYLIYGADVNQDGIVDTGDMNEVDNGSTAILIGYNLPDVNGDGIVDTSDMNTVDNNSTAIVMIRLPF